MAQYLMQYGEKELNYEEFKAVIDLVMNMSAKAKEVGANAIVGIRMDFDEISANPLSGRSMRGFGLRHPWTPPAPSSRLYAP